MTDQDLPTRILGRTGMAVTRLGYGSVELRNARPEARRVTDAVAGELLNAVLDEGINFVDTSPDYGLAEEMIGRFISHRRSEYFLASKAGCRVTDEPGGGGRHLYTRANVIEGVEQSLRRMRTDYLDLVQFHGRPVLAELQAGGAIEALQDLQRAGKVRFIGASATLPDLPDLIATGLFDVFQIPYSLLDRAHESAIADAARAGAGTVIRGGAARGAPSDEKQWVDASLGVSEQAARGMWTRAALDDLLDGASRMEFTLRFTLSHPHLDTAIVGTSRVAHLRDNLVSLRRGPLPADVYAEALRRLDAAALRS